MILYIYDTDTDNLMDRIHGDSNTAVEAKANELYGSNDVAWSYTQKDELGYDGENHQV